MVILLALLTLVALNRTTSETVQSPDPAELSAVAYAHDGNGNVTRVQETVNGAIARTVDRSYDSFDRLNIERERYADSHLLGKALQYGYDPAGNRVSLTDVSDPNHAVDLTTWTYNDLNQNDSVTVRGTDATRIDHYPSGLERTITRANGSTTVTGYDGAGRIESITHRLAGGDIAHVRYDYDLDGNRWHQYESNGALTGNAEQPTAYSYDLADRLTDVVTPDRTTHYDLDPVGNRTSERITDASNTLVSSSTLAYNEREQLTQRDDSTQGLHVALTYDPDGNTATSTDATGTRTSSYDAHDRLLTLTPPDASALSFDYDHTGLRLAKRQGNAQTRYQYDDQALLAETNAIGNVLARYHYSASSLIARTDAGSERQYLLDALKTPIATLRKL